jgi:DNA-binding NarL/FixJ family response regulator
MQPAKRRTLINHKLTPLALDDEHNIWLALCVVTHSAAARAGNITITKKGSNKLFEYNRTAKKWTTQKKIKLTNQEKEILTLTVQGFTMCEIAQKLKIVEVTVKFHKKNIFNKLQVKNIAAAISCATNYNLFE